MNRNRSRIIVEIDLDPVPGWGNKAEDHLYFLRDRLDDALGHYNPTVTLAPQPASPAADGEHVHVCVTCAATWDGEKWVTA